MRSSDYDASSGTLLIAQSKSGKSRRIPLTEEGDTLFGKLAEGKPEGASLLTKSDGSPWGKSEQSRRIKDACKLAKIDPPISFHALRHSYASLLVEAGTPLAFVADALGHSDTRGLAYQPVVHGERISGTYRRNVTLASGRFAMLEDGVGFTLVSWRRDHRAAPRIIFVGTVRGDSVSWDIGRQRGMSR